MNSFHPSRGRILFEVLCALAISASCAAAWLQTGASALLAAASVAALYGLVHAFDIFRRKPADAILPQPVEFERELQADRPAHKDAVVPMVPFDEQPARDDVVAEAELVEPATPKTSESRRTKSPRKSGARRAKAPKEANVAELVPPDVPEILNVQSSEEAEFEMPVSDEEMTNIPLAPLFEPEPFVRQQRAIFGRKAG